MSDSKVYKLDQIVTIQAINCKKDDRIVTLAFVLCQMALSSCLKYISCVTLNTIDIVNRIIAIKGLNMVRDQNLLMTILTKPVKNSNRIIHCISSYAFQDRPAGNKKGVCEPLSEQFNLLL